MNEIEKLYENAGVKANKYKLCCTGCKHIAKVEVINGYPLKWICDKYDEVANCDKAEPDYPPFTAEKQLHLIKWLSDKADYIDIHYDRYKGLFNIQTGMGGLYVCNEFEQALASRVNIIWQDLTEAEQNEIKNILEE
jgi:hypothetical protein